jgi:hypothetical protein
VTTMDWAVRAGLLLPSGRRPEAILEDSDAGQIFVFVGVAVLQIDVKQGVPAASATFSY